MKRRWLILSAAVAASFLCAAGPAAADERGPLGDLFGYIRLASPKAELAARAVNLNDRVRRAEQDREIKPSEARELYRRLDRVRDFLRDDRDLSRDEFKRRDGDLDRIERDLDRKVGRRGERRR